MIGFRCPNCAHRVGAPDEYIGKKVKCPKCGGPILVPQQSQESLPNSADLIKFRCSNCAKKLGVPIDYAGRQVRCTKCGQPCSVPEPGLHVQPATLPAESAPSDDIPGVNVWDDEDLSSLEDGSPIQMETTAPPSAQLQAGSGVECYKCGAKNRADTEFCVVCASPMMTTIPSSRAGAIVRGIGPIPLALAASFGFTLVGAIIWALLASVFGVRWTAFLATVVGPLGGVGLIVFIDRRNVGIGLLAVLIGLCGIISGKVFIAKWVVMPELVPKFAEFINVAKDELRGAQISDEMVQETLKNPRAMFTLTLMQLAEDGEIEQDVAESLAFDWSSEPIPPDLEEQRESVEKKVYSCLSTWTAEEKEKVIKAQFPKVVSEFADLFSHIMQTGLGTAIGFLAAFLGSFTCLDVMWFPIALWGAYKLGAGWD